MALSFLVVIISIKNTVSDYIFWILLTVYVVLLTGWGIYALIQRYQHAKKGEEIATALSQSSVAERKYNNKKELQLISQQVKQSIQLIRKSKLGDRKGHAALYELPWYMVIGNPAAGKSSAIYHSGLRFPFEEKHQKLVSAGLSGTRNCDWFFSTQGILLDTAGRYSVYPEDHSEWLDFLNILKKNRSKAPVNGLIVIVSVAELVNQSPEKSLQLAKNLRARIQDLTERLEVFAPVYLVFSKMDLIAGFTEFFDGYHGQEFDQVWGATLAYKPDSSENAVQLFEKHYGILYEGLKNVSTAHLTRRHSQHISPSVMTFPLEFKSLKPVLRTFIATLFQENPYQFKPIFRGFYFTSALQEGSIESPMTAQIAEDFHLIRNKDHDHSLPTQSVSQNHGYFLKDLFSEVILKDKYLVKQHINPARKRRRFVAFSGALLTVSIVLSLCVWSYRNNQHLMAEVQGDLNKIVRMQKQSGTELATQIDALLILQGHLQQFDQFDRKRPFKYSFGLYQGQQIREKLQAEYLQGIEQLILQPSQQNIEEYLQRVKNNAAVLKENHINVRIHPAAHVQQLGLEPSDQNPQDAYNALKTYLMLSNREYIDSSHLSDQLTRFWRIWLDQHRGQLPRAEMLQKAEQLLSYAMTQTDSSAFPQLDSDTVLVEQTRQVLTAMTTGVSARDRVYNEIKMRASVRFPALTIKQIVGGSGQTMMLGSYALPGFYSYQAWNEYIQPAIETAAHSPTESKDWVLNTSQSDDLSFSGSPEQIQRQLIEMYKKEYIREWRKFLGAIYYAKSADFNQQMYQIDILGEPENSPIRKVIQRVAQETSWDNPLVQAELAVPQKGFIAWFKRKILQLDDAKLTQNSASTLSQGVIAKDFQLFYQIVRSRDDLQNRSLLDEYMQSLAKVRSRFNDLKSSGDIGPASIILLKQTIDEQNSIFNITQKFVDEKMSVGTHELDQQLIKKLFSVPLTRSFESLILPAQAEVNKLWLIQAYQPFNGNLSQKYPFSTQGSLQATSQEINQIFGENGSIARFVKEYLDPLVIRRGYSLSSKTWQDIGLNLNPLFVENFQNYVAPVHGMATGELNNNSHQSVTPNQSNFQFYPLEQAHLLAYTIDIDGQRMLFENGIQQWVNFIWPNSGAIPGARITMIDLEGKTHTIFDEPGEYGINRLIDSAQRIQKGNIFELIWRSKENPELFVKTNFRLVSGNNASSIGSNPSYSNLQLVDQVVSNKAVRVVAAQNVTMSGKTALTSAINIGTPLP
nr:MULTISPECIES: type VI secretion system membrane subunit TssM [unclassified Acinetobacter]